MAVAEELIFDLVEVSRETFRDRLDDLGVQDGQLNLDPPDFEGVQVDYFTRDGFYVGSVKTDDDGATYLLVETE